MSFAIVSFAIMGRACPPPARHPDLEEGVRGKAAKRMEPDRIREATGEALV
jgi:hypothetical protein